MKIFTIAFLCILSSVCFGQSNTFCAANQPCTYSGNDTFTGRNTFKFLNNIRFADQFNATDPGLGIQAAIADLPATGGKVDACGYSGTFTATVNPFAGNTKPVLVTLCAVTINTNVSWNTGATSSVLVQGMGRTATQIQASASFPISSHLAHIGDGAALIFGTRFENLRLNCNGIAGCTALYTQGLNEQSGGAHLLLSSFLANGLYIDGTTVTTQHFRFDDIETSANAAAVSKDDIVVDSTGPGGVISRFTGNPNGGAGLQGACIHVKGTGSNGYIQAIGVHCENHADGLFFDTGTRGDVYNVDLNTGTNVLHTATTGDVAATNVAMVSGVTNVVKNDQVSYTCTDQQLPIYMQTRTFAGQQVFAWTGNSSSCGNIGGSGTPRFSLKASDTSLPHVDMLDSSGNGYAVQGSGNSGTPFFQLRPVSGGTLGSATFILGNTGVLTINDLFKFKNTGTSSGALTGTFTANRAFTFQDASGTIPLLETAQTWNLTQTLKSLTVDSASDATNTIIFNCGLTTAQTCIISFRDRNTAKWLLQNSTSNNFQVFENGGIGRLQFNAGAASQLNSAGTGAVAINGVTNAGTGGVTFGSGGASPTTVASVDAAGKGTFNGGLAPSSTGNVTWTSGAGAPAAGNCTTAKGGSLFSRTDGTTTTTLYVCDGSTGVWTAK